MRPVPRRPLRLLFVASVLAACDGAPTAPARTLPPRALDLSLAWETAQPAEVGFDTRRLASAIDAVGSAQSLVIARNGYLVHESYARGITRESLNDVRSVTKSIVSALVGVALRDGLLTGIDQRLDALLPAPFTLDTDAKRAIRLEHLLTMTSGFEWLETGAVGYNEWILSDDHVRYLLDRPLRDPPGTFFSYNTAGAHLVGVLLAHAAGEPLPAWSQRAFFDEIGIPRVQWEPLADRYVNGGSGIELRAVDLARIGQLMLQGGASGLRQVLPADWVAASVHPRFTSFGFVDGLQHANYGLLWWIETADPNAFFAWGYGGQFVYVVPDHHLVVVLTNDWHGSGAARRAGPALRAIARIVDAAR